MTMRSKKEIEDKSRKVLLDHGLYSIPVDPVILANKLGFKANNAVFSDENIAGLTSKRGGEILLLVNENDHPFRKRFTIAHELAHHFLHLFEEEGDHELVHNKVDMFRMSAPPDEPSYTSERLMEIEANRFAAALLMPAEFVRQKWDELRSIEKLARIFNVSEEAMGYRIGDLGLE